MARHWAPLRDPEVAETRSRSISRVGTVGTQWGQRPMFSEPGEDQPLPEQGVMGPEGRLDDIYPSDGRQSSDEVADLAKAEALVPVHFMESVNNVSSTPTDAELEAAFGSRAVGDAFIVRDNGGSGVIMLIVRGGEKTWWFEILTKAT